MYTNTHTGKIALLSTNNLSIRCIKFALSVFADKSQLCPLSKNADDFGGEIYIVVLKKRQLFHRSHIIIQDELPHVENNNNF